jgi:multidrug efflux pump
MRFTDLFIQRPLLAWVLNALILLFGLVAFGYLGLRPYPDVQPASIYVDTAYPGAPADVVQGFVTGPLQRAIIGAEGIDYYTSSSSDGHSSITIYNESDFDLNQLVTDVIGKVASVRGELPPNALEPVITKSFGSSPPLWVRLQDEHMTPEQLTEYFYRVVRPSILTREGVAGLMILGERPFAMRLWIDPVRMAAMDVTAAELQAAVRNNNFTSEAGELRDSLVVQPVRAATDISSAEAFAGIVIRESDGAVVRVRDVASVELASAPERKNGFVDGEPGLLIGVSMAPDSNPLALSRNVREGLVELEEKLPASMSVGIFSDHGKYVENALLEVTGTLFEALVIVAFITLLFFGNPRSVLIMLISIPLSLIGTFLVMWLMGYTLNLFTMLALVIAIGLVVDDTIVVVENIHRHIEEGMAPMQAAYAGAREVIGPVISMSLTLVAVFLPVSFMQGLSGQLISEFVFTLAGSVVISGVVALTLSPMLCSRVLRPEQDNSIAHWLDQRFDILRRRYADTLRASMQYRPVWVLVALVVIGTLPALFMLSNKEVVPLEDPGYVHTAYSVPGHLSEEFITESGARVDALLKELPEYTGSLRLEGILSDGTSMIAAELAPWGERERSAMELRNIVQEMMNKVPGIEANTFIVDMSPAGAAGSMPIQMALQTTVDYVELAEVSNRILEAIRNSGNFIFAANDLKYSKPQINVDINRDKAGELGIDMEDIATTLSVMLGEGYISRFSYKGESYDVIPQANPAQRVDRAWLERYYVRSASGDSIPLSTLVTTRLDAEPRSLNQFNGLNTATISLVPMPGVSMQEALDYLEQLQQQMLPAGFSVDYSGQARTFLQSGNTLLIAFLLSLLTIYLFLVAQFESLRDPLVVLVTVPMSLSGALIFLCLDFATLSLFSQVGLITLVGLISKHGILVVDFARRLQARGVDFQDAIIEAAAVRLRPILMTTAAIVMAVIPLLLASGPGAVSRYHIGLVIVTGMAIGTLFTLFVLPVVYSYIAQRRQGVSEQAQEAPLLRARE